MSKALAVCAVFSVLIGAPLLRSQDEPAIQPFSPEDLDNLLASIALYPDPLLAQILPAATFPDQIDEAARFIRAGANPDAIDVQPWDVSVKATAHYASVIEMMADRLDWTTALGQAYINQPDDVMASVQRLRQQARNAGNLVTTPQDEIVVDNGDIEVWPAQAEYCYLPIYDPALAFFGSGGVFGGPVVTFGPALPIGVWLNNNFDWRHHRIYYHGWSQGGGWMARSLPYIHLNNVYVNKNLGNINVNRGVVKRPVNYNNLASYNSVHRNATYGNSRINPPSSEGASNKIIERNMNVNDARTDWSRGHIAPSPQPTAPTARETPRPGNSAFSAERSSFGAKATSERGQSSRAQASHSSGGGFHGGGGGAGSRGGGGGGGSHGGGGGRH